MKLKKLREALNIFHEDHELYVQMDDGSIRKLDGIDINGVKEADGSVHKWDGTSTIGDKRVFILIPGERV